MKTCYTPVTKTGLFVGVHLPVCFFTALVAPFLHHAILDNTLVALTVLLTVTCLVAKYNKGSHLAASIHHLQELHTACRLPSFAVEQCEAISLQPPFVCKQVQSLHQNITIPAPLPGCWPANLICLT